jgi:hypothetical protein
MAKDITQSEHPRIMQSLVDYVAAGGESSERSPLLLGALQCCFKGRNEDHVLFLLESGENPNEPSGWAVFTMMLATTNSIPIATKLIECGLNLNEVYMTDRDLGHFSSGESTILDHVYGVQAYLSPKRKKRKELTETHAVRLSPRRRFIEELIVLLRSSGAMRAPELTT